MRHVRVALAAAIVAVVSLPAGATGPDWALLSIETGASGATDLRASISATVRPVGHEPRLVGLGVSDGVDPTIEIVPAGSVRLRLTTSRDAAGADVSILSGDRQDTLTVRSSLIVDGWLPPWTRMSLLVFVPGMTLETLSITEPTFSAGAASSWTRTGSGSSTVLAVDPGDAGAAAAFGPLALSAGSVHGRSVDRGLVGAFTSGFCLSCVASWTGPSTSGRFGTYDGAGGASSDRVFAGEAGVWRWSWSGAGWAQPSVPAEPALAAYAPLGDVWPLFWPAGR